MLKVKLINEKTPLKIKMVAKFPSVVLANLQDKETTPTKETQVVVADKTYDGLSKVTVNPIPNEYIIPSGEIEFTQNGTYDVTDKASAKVNVPEKQLGTKTITTNGTYKASDDNLDGYSEVEVNIGKYAPRRISFSGYKGTELDYEIENLDTSRITNCDNMFSACQNLKQIKSFDTSNVTSMRTFVYYCNELSEFPLFNMSKVSDFTQARSRQLGFTHYKWVTSRDERVSEEHKHLDGRIYAYDNPTALIDKHKNIGHPSQRVNCRCHAVSVILDANQELKLVKDANHGDYYVIRAK